MPTAPRVSDFPKIRGALAVYRVLAYATGIFLLILVVEILVKYGFGLEAELGGAGGFVTLVPVDQHTGINLSLAVQITHGYFYLAYLVTDFVLITFLRWPITRFLLIAAGGVVPLLSFFTEHRITREVKGYLASREAAVPTPAASEARH
jgi:integral membrane protein